MEKRDAEPGHQDKRFLERELGIGKCTWDGRKKGARRRPGDDLGSRWDGPASRGAGRANDDVYGLRGVAPRRASGVSARPAGPRPRR